MEVVVAIEVEVLLAAGCRGADPWLQVVEHVYEKVMNGGSEAGSGAGTPTGDRAGEGEEGGSVAEAQVARSLFVCLFVCIHLARWSCCVTTRCWTLTATCGR